MRYARVHYAGRLIARIPYAAVSPLRLFWVESGLDCEWDGEGGTLSLAPCLKGTVWVLADEEEHEPVTLLVRDVLDRLQRLLDDTGVQVKRLSGTSPWPEDGEPRIRFSVAASPDGKGWGVSVHKPPHGGGERLADCLESQLQGDGLLLPAAGRESGESDHSVEIRCLVPAGWYHTGWEAYADRLSFSLAAALLGYFVRERSVSPLNLIAPYIVQAAMADAEAKERAESAQSASHSESKHMASAAHQPALRMGVEQTAPQAAVVAPTQAAMAATPYAGAGAAGGWGMLKLDSQVFFDYTVFRSELPQQAFLIFGSVLMKNTGTVDLLNPVVCLRATPPECVKLGGQIVPSGMVDTLGVQSSEGAKGWRFLEPGPTQPREAGVYWIAPIQPLRIAPGGVERLQHIQLAITAPQAGGLVVVEAQVFFHEQGLEVGALNRIAVSC